MASAPCSPSLAAAAAAAVGRGPRSAAVPGNSSNKKLTTCLCSPTNHPGSFRCIRHRNGPRGGPAAPTSAAAAEATRGRASKSKGRSVRALLLQRISTCPSDRDRQQRRRRRSGDFQPRPSRLRLMNM